MDTQGDVPGPAASGLCCGPLRTTGQLGLTVPSSRSSPETGRISAEEGSPLSALWFRAELHCSCCWSRSGAVQSHPRAVHSLARPCRCAHPLTLPTAHVTMEFDGLHPKQSSETYLRSGEAHCGVGIPGREVVRRLWSSSSDTPRPGSLCDFGQMAFPLWASVGPVLRGLDLVMGVASGDCSLT